jgi:hypothetical protein
MEFYGVVDAFFAAPAEQVGITGFHHNFPHILIKLAKRLYDVCHGVPILPARR